jgi:hypothetical protein
MRRIAVLVAAVSALTLAACSAAEVDDTTRDDSGAVTDGGTLGVAKLRVGDCVNLGDVATQESGEVDAFEAIPCSDPHQGEVYLVENTYFADGSYPGDDAASAQSEEACGPAFEGFVGEAYEESTLDFVSLYPTQGSWDAGDRSVVCLVVKPTESGEDLETVTGSLKA